MTTNHDIPLGAPVWADLLTSDPARSQDFYGQLFGWTVEDPADDGRDYGGYRNLLHGGVRNAGCMVKQPGMEVPDVWTVYLRTADIKESLDRVEANGGVVHVPANDVHELGRFALVQDPAGAAVGLWEPGTHAGFGHLSEPGAPSWFELHTRDYDASVDFYTKVFAWPAHTAADEPGFRYTTYGKDEAARAGIMDAAAFLPDGVPSHWAIYFATADADATIAQATKLGASVVQAAEDTPYGRLATLADPTGALFKLQQPL